MTLGKIGEMPTSKIRMISGQPSFKSIRSFVVHVNPIGPALVKEEAMALLERHGVPLIQRFIGDHVLPLVGDDCDGNFEIRVWTERNDIEPDILILAQIATTPHDLLFATEVVKRCSRLLVALFDEDVSLDEGDARDVMTVSSVSSLHAAGAARLMDSHP